MRASLSGICLVVLSTSGLTFPASSRRCGGESGEANDLGQWTDALSAAPDIAEIQVGVRARRRRRRRPPWQPTMSR